MLSARGLTFLELLFVLAIFFVLGAISLTTLLVASWATDKGVALTLAHNVLKAACAYLAQDPGAFPVGEDYTDGLAAGSYSVPDHGLGVAFCQLTWRDNLPQVAVRSRSGRSFTLP